MTTAYVTHPLYTAHDIPGHPERPARVQAIWQTLERAKLLDKLHAIHPTAVDDDKIMWVHTPEYAALLHYAANHDDGLRFDADTTALPVTPEVARLSAGGVVAAVDAVLSGTADNALAVTRPPGHHAIPQRAMGFCFLGNVAIGARYAQKQYGLQRVMIVDYDVHHGNGTQDIFYGDDSVLFVSTHQYPFYPGTGALEETGENQGKGYTLNIPLTAGHGDSDYLHLYKEVLWPMARRFQPELILVSAGFDAHWFDPLAMMNLSLNGYAQLSRELISMADSLCDGRIVFALEGGYDLNVVAGGVRNVAHALLREDLIVDEMGVKNQYDLDMSDLIERIKTIHQL